MRKTSFRWAVTLKEYFDYEIPVAIVEDAGITSTGSASEGNQLPQLQQEYRDYREKHPLWQTAPVHIKYSLNADFQVVRTWNNKETIL